MSFINFTSGLVEVAIVDIFLRQWEHGFHATSSKILRTHTHQARNTLGGVMPVVLLGKSAGIATKIDLGAFFG